MIRDEWAHRMATVGVDAYKQAHPVPKAKETPMPELKPCPIPSCHAKAEYLLEGNARCSDHDCPLGRAGTWIPVAAWQALPRPEEPECERCDDTGWISDRDGGGPCYCRVGVALEEVHLENAKLHDEVRALKASQAEKGEEEPVPEERRCRTCFFMYHHHGRVCDDCDGSRNRWRPNRPGDEGRIREKVETSEHYIRRGDTQLVSLLAAVVSAGRALASKLGLSYLDALRSRMSEATSRLGPWDVNDGRDYRREALEELLDAACYLAAEKVREDGK